MAKIIWTVLHEEVFSNYHTHFYLYPLLDTRQCAMYKSVTVRVARTSLNLIFDTVAANGYLRKLLYDYMYNGIHFVRKAKDKVVTRNIIRKK